MLIVPAVCHPPQPNPGHPNGLTPRHGAATGPAHRGLPPRVPMGINPAAVTNVQAQHSDSSQSQTFRALSEKRGETAPPRRTSSIARISLGLMSTLTLAGCSDALDNQHLSPGNDDNAVAATPTPAFGRYHATIRRTEYGIPHILADDLGSAAFGQGYVFAQNDACILADQIVKVRSERARYFGSGDASQHLDSDFGYLHLRVYEYAQKIFSTQPSDVQELITGFAAGYNQYLADVGPAGLPVECRNVPWVKSISSVDLLAYYTAMAMLSSSEALIPGMARAAPPTTTALQTPYGPLLPMNSLREGDIGSNAIAIGKDLSDNGKGMLLANPHFAWEGELRLFESQLTVPGLLNIYGVSLMGVAGINIGFNEHIAWSHTVSHAVRGTFYQVTLDPKSATTYLYDGQKRTMEMNTYTIQVLQADGTLKPLTRNLWRTQYGPVLATDQMGWTRKSAVTFRDANANNPRLLEQFLRMAESQSLDDLIGVHATVNAIPWVNTIATDSDGNTFYTDSSSVPALSDATITAWESSLQTMPLSQIAWELGAPLLDGSTSRDEWVATNHPRMSGLIPFADAPSLERTDYVANGNDNHWLTHLTATLEGFSPMYLPERAPRTPRTRMNLRLLTERGSTAASGSDGHFSLDELSRLVMDNRSIMSELLLKEVVTRCTGVKTVRYNSTLVNIENTCKALSNYDGRLNPDSVGVAAWREFLGAFDFSDLEDAGPLFAVAFDPNNPIATPNTLAPKPTKGTDTVLEALAAATVALQTAGISPSLPLKDIQKVTKNGEKISIHGSNAREGAVNVVSYSGGNLFNSTLLPKTQPGTIINESTSLTANGYPINYGTSFVMALQYTGDGPKARALLTYSQSNDTSSPYNTDQTRLFSAKTWRTIRYSETDISASPALETYEVGSKN